MAWKRLQFFVLFVVILSGLGYLINLRGASKISSAFVTFSCQTHAPKVFHLYASSPELSAQERTDKVMHLVDRFVGHAKKKRLSWDSLMENNSDENKKWDADTAEEIRDRCPEQVPDGLDLVCYTRTLVALGTPMARMMIGKVRNDMVKQDMFKGKCLAGE